jgi:flagellar biosynthesis GTPase FlhF
MDINVSIVLSRENTEYRSVAQRHWNLTDDQMKGMHVHHEPPVALGGRNIPEHLYVCSPEMHLGGWHKGAKYPMMASEGGKLSAVVRRKNAEEMSKLSDKEKEEVRRQKKERVEKKKEKEKKNREYAQRVRKALSQYEEKVEAEKRMLEELHKLQSEMIDAGLILPDPEGLLL